jgi:hypothetical protein
MYVPNNQLAYHLRRRPEPNGTVGPSAYPGIPIIVTQLRGTAELVVPALVILIAVSQTLGAYSRYLNRGNATSRLH